MTQLYVEREKLTTGPVAFLVTLCKINMSPPTTTVKDSVWYLETLSVSLTSLASIRSGRSTNTPRGFIVPLEVITSAVSVLWFLADPKCSSCVRTFFDYSSLNGGLPTFALSRRTSFRPIFLSLYRMPISN